MGIRVTSLSGFIDQGAAGQPCCGQRGVRGLGDPIMMLEGVGALVTSGNKPSTSIVTSPPPPTTTPQPPDGGSRCRPGETYDRIEQMCIPSRTVAPTLVATFRPFKGPVIQEEAPPPPGGAPFADTFAPPSLPGGATAPPPQQPPVEAASSPNVKVAIAAGGALIAAALFLRRG